LDFDDRPAVSLRPFFVFAGQQFTARQTVETVFGSAFQPLWGGGLQVAFRGGFFIDLTALRFKKTGERAFFFEGEGFPLGIPMTVTLTPFETTFGYRFAGPSRRLIPYFGGGLGTYAYRERSDDADGDEDLFEARELGYLVVGGLEARLGRWIAVTGDVQFTHVPNIIGTGGVSQQAEESDLGGTAARVRVVIGR
jgi:hypothetical protein